jgi:lipopolysaccharide transport system ATP-binding protein
VQPGDLTAERIDISDDTAAETVAAYLRNLEGIASQDLFTRTDRRGNGQIRMTQVEISVNGNSPHSVLSTGRPARFAFSVDIPRPSMSCSFTIYDQFGQPVTFFDSAVQGREDISDSSGATRFICEMDELTLMPGRYRINAAIMWNGELQDHLEAAAYLMSSKGSLEPSAPKEMGYGNLLIQHRWITPEERRNER